jgi:hypothetical protein
MDEQQLYGGMHSALSTTLLLWKPSSLRPDDQRVAADERRESPGLPTCARIRSEASARGRHRPDSAVVRSDELVGDSQRELLDGGAGAALEALADVGAAVEHLA